MVKTTEHISYQIKLEIEKSGNEKKAAWLENYVKHDIKSKGVGIPKIREIVKRSAKQYDLIKLPFEQQIILLDDLMSSVYTEDKLAAILYMQLYWKDVPASIVLKIISRWFDYKWISDWNVCDWLSVRLLSRAVDQNPKEAIGELNKWNESLNLWKARASLVPFAKCKTIAKHKTTIKKFSSKLIKREERFCKSGVGWVLRSYSKYDKKFVKAFLKDHEKWLIPEVLKNSTKYF